MDGAWDGGGGETVMSQCGDVDMLWIISASVILVISPTVLLIHSGFEL